MRIYFLALTLLALSNLQSQTILLDAKLSAETSTAGQVAIEGYSGPIGPIVPPPTDTESIGVKGIGYTGIRGEARANGGAGVHGKTSRFAGRGIYGESTGPSGFGVFGYANGQSGWGVYGLANGDGEWGGYFSGGKGLLARPRLGVENFNPQYPIHVGTNTNNGNGAHVTNGGTWVNGSSRSFKTNLRKIDGQQLLEELAALDITRWQYRGSDEGDHIGPMAEDFYAAFGLGDDKKYISTTDGIGVALAAIQTLYRHILILEKENEKQAMIIDQISYQLKSEKEVR